MASRRKRASPRISGPFLRRITSVAERVDLGRYPFNIPAFSHGVDIAITSNVTFFVGENGSGKSTLLEAIAENSGFNPRAAVASIRSQGAGTAQIWPPPFASRGRSK
jgi:predicted ATPase